MSNRRGPDKFTKQGSGLVLNNNSMRQVVEEEKTNPVRSTSSDTASTADIAAEKEALRLERQRQTDLLAEKEALRLERQRQKDLLADRVPQSSEARGKSLRRRTS